MRLLPISTRPHEVGLLLTILIIAEENESVKAFALSLARAGYNVIFSTVGEAIPKIAENPSDAVLLEVTEAKTKAEAMALLRQIKEKVSLPIIALVSDEAFPGLEPELLWDDFVVIPCDERELVLRVKRLLGKNNDKEGSKMVSGDLIIDVAKYEVSLAGKRVELTYREYELLRFLMSNKGRVFTRQDLMNNVWGYDYFGGDRTVDVHIRRLRSKIESRGHSFIETARNIGYRFRDSI